MPWKKDNRGRTWIKRFCYRLCMVTDIQIQMDTDGHDFLPLYIWNNFFKINIETLYISVNSYSLLRAWCRAYVNSYQYNTFLRERFFSTLS